MQHHKKINQLRHDARCVVRELGLLNDAYFDIGVTLAERHLLIELASGEAPTMGEIADRLLLDKSTVSRLIAKAMKKGYVAAAIDREDKRKRLLSLTEIGRNTLNAFEPIAFSQTRDALDTLSNEEKAVVYRGMALYAKGLKTARQQSAAQAIHEGDRRKLMSELSVSGIPDQLAQRGFELAPFERGDEQGLYDIFREVVDSGSEFPYESNTFDEFQRQFFATASQVYVCRTITAKQVVGGFYIKSNYTGRSSHIANAAYMIKGSCRGKGLGTLLVKASLEIAGALGFHAMQFNMVLSKNTIANNLYRKLGFKNIGTLPRAVRNPDGTYQDGLILYKALDQA